MDLMPYVFAESFEKDSRYTSPTLMLRFQGSSFFQSYHHCVFVILEKTDETIVSLLTINPSYFTDCLLYHNLLHFTAFVRFVYPLINSKLSIVCLKYQPYKCTIKNSNPNRLTDSEPRLFSIETFSDLFLWMRLFTRKSRSLVSDLTNYYAFFHVHDQPNFRI